jgi:imidazoleglycerol phosphate dehydratase HisB
LIWLEVAIDLDRPEPVEVETDIGYLNELIGYLARNGGFGLTMACEGGLRADQGLIMQDCALELGGALWQALGNPVDGACSGAAVAVDDVRATASLEFSERPGAELRGVFDCKQVNGLQTELIAPFFAALARALGCRILVQVDGVGAAPMIAACFGALGLALRDAIQNEEGDRPNGSWRL